METERPPMIVAHRGASDDAPENTLAAFELAWQQDADAIEGDFRMTRDGEILCIHDAVTRRVADRSLAVADSTSTELRALDVGRWRGAEWTGVAIPSLAEVVATVPEGKMLFTEVKCGPEIVRKLVTEINGADCHYDQIRVISVAKDVIHEVKRQEPALKAVWLSWIKEASPGRLVPTTDTILATLRQTGANGFGSSYALTTRELVEKVIDAGYEYHVWTVDDPQSVRRFRDWGVTSVTSNAPGRIKQVLAEG